MSEAVKEAALAVNNLGALHSSTKKMSAWPNR